MKKKLFLFLVLLMSLSLIGIILVQGFWIKNTVESKEAQFSFNAKQLLREVSDQIEEDEFEEYYFAILSKTDSMGKPVNVTVDQLLRIQNSVGGDNTYIYSNSVIQEDYKLFSPFLSGSNDSIEFKKLINKRVTGVIRNDEIEGNKLSAQERFVRVTQMDAPMRELVRGAITEITTRLPIYKRIDEGQLEVLIKNQLEKRGIDSDIEFGIYSNGIATKVKTEGFEPNESSTYGIPIFDTDDPVNDHDYELKINFIDKKKEVLSSVGLMASLSVIFTLVIVATYSTTLSQLVKQRQVSQIKTDFINNMTHEFKTPIATINLALDSIKNPKISQDQEKTKRYLGMIRDENERMHAQVENVLRISELERNELNIKKERLELTDLVEDAISHVELILEDQQGYVKTHFNAKKSSILANETHFTNVIVNILDNAVKYSLDSAKIDVYTENVKNYIVLKIQDQGVGMGKSVQRKIFQKFYREHTGNIHNVKGHGLGLAYVKRILTDHHAEVSVESIKGKGSTFIIKLPLIT